MAFPESVVDLLAGRMGQPPGGFPKAVQDRVLRGQAPLTGRPGESLAPADFDAVEKEIEGKFGFKPSRRDVLTYMIYPRVFGEYIASKDQFSDLSVLPTPLFFYGLDVGEEASVEIEPGKVLIIKFLTVGDPYPDGRRTVFFELNGQPRNVSVRDRSVEATGAARQKAEAGNPTHVGAPMPGMIAEVAVKKGDAVKKGQKLMTMEAMKMETTLYAERDGRALEVLVTPGSQVDTGDLVLRLE